MTTQNNEIKFALDFPQGRMLFMEKGPGSSSDGDIGAIYFQPHKSDDAFLVYGERKELFGKHAICVDKDTDTGAGAYNIVYEFSHYGALMDARLMTKDRTWHGTQVDKKTVQAANEALALNTITLHRRNEPDEVCNVAQFPDGKLLIQLRNRNELYLGTPDNYSKVDARLTAQGGASSMYYNTARGESIELPYGFDDPVYDNVPKFNGEALTYLEVKSGEDPVKFGLDLSRGIVHLGPFSPQPSTPKPQRLQQKFRP